ncbi:hypothetical protein SUGI_0466370 [Cryptomeria japonica]|nr:hypothetical protein SUGI_0466370 [Cryptomeria japonica]
MSLSSLFLSRLDHNRLTEILDDRVLEEENLHEMEDMSRIARECLHLERRKRPSMKEVVEELVWVRCGTRNTKFHDNKKCEDAIFEERSITDNTIQIQELTFLSPVGSTAVVQMSILTE